MDNQLHAAESHDVSHTSQPPATITLDQFLNLVKLRTAKVVGVETIPNKDRLYKVTVEMGSETRTIVSGIREWYPNPEELIGKMVAIVSNLEPKKLGGVESQGMLLAALDDEGKFSLLVAEREVKSGAEVR